jgi:hypothetical protein
LRLLSYYVVGAALDETSGYARGPSAVEPVPDSVVAREYPTLSRLGLISNRAVFHATFFTGLDLLLDGIEIAYRGGSK